MAIDNGAAALGLVSQMPSGPGTLPEEDIVTIADVVPPGVATFLLTSLQDVESVIAQQRRTRVDTLQLCDRLLTGTHRDLGSALPGIALVQVVHVTGTESLDEALSLAPHVDAILLDSGRPHLAVKELGGTGRLHDWSISRRIREAVTVPVFLAGGLKAENVRAAIHEVGPFGIDVCTGVRTEGRLDPERLARFFDGVAAASWTTH